MDLGLVVGIIFVAVMLVILWAILRAVVELIWGLASWLAPVVCVIGVGLEILLFLRKVSATPAEANTLHLVVLGAGALYALGEKHLRELEAHAASDQPDHRDATKVRGG